MLNDIKTKETQAKIEKLNSLFLVRETPYTKQQATPEESKLFSEIISEMNFNTVYFNDETETDWRAEEQVIKALKIYAGYIIYQIGLRVIILKSGNIYSICEWRYGNYKMGLKALSTHNGSIENYISRELQKLKTLRKQYKTKKPFHKMSDAQQYTYLVSKNIAIGERFKPSIEIIRTKDDENGNPRFLSTSEYINRGDKKNPFMILYRAGGVEKVKTEKAIEILKC